MPAATDQRLTTSAAARLAAVSEQTVRTWARSGHLPHEATPLGMLIDRRVLDAFLAQRRARLGGDSPPPAGA